MVLGERPRSRHGIQQSFHETKRETPNKAKPQAVTTSDSRLTDTSASRIEKVTLVLTDQSDSLGLVAFG